MFTAGTQYGGPQPPQPDPAGAAMGMPAAAGTAGHARTVARPEPGFLGNPALLLVVLVGLAALLVNFSVSVSVKG